MNKTNLRKSTRRALAATTIAASAALLAGGAWAEVRSGTISASTTLDSLEVTSSLEITGEGVVVTIAPGGSVKVGDGVLGARLAVTDGASLVVADRNSSAQKIIIGLNGGSGTLVVDGGTIDCYDLSIATGASSSDAAAGAVVLSNGALVSAKNKVNLSDSSDASAAAGDIRASVEIGTGSTLNCWALSSMNSCSNVVSFTGGTLQAAIIMKEGSGVMELRGVGDSEISIEQIVSSSYGTGNAYLFYNSSGSVVLSGQAGARFSSAYPTSVYPNQFSRFSRNAIQAKYEGGTTFAAGTIRLYHDSQLPKGGDVVIAAGAVLDLGGHAQTIGALSGSGTLRNGNSGSSSLILGGTSNAFSGTVSVTNGAMTLATANTRRHYKVVVEATHESSADAFQFPEFALFNAKGERVNLNSSLAGTPSTENSSLVNDIYKLFDGDTTTGIYLLKGSGPLVFSFSLANETPVTGYLFATRTDKTTLNPKAPGTWKIYTSDTALAANADGWIEIDSVSGYRQTSGYGWYAYNGGVPMAFNKPAGSLAAFSPSATISVATGTTLNLTNTGTAIGNIVVDCATGGGTITGGSLAASGTVTLTGAITPLPMVYAVPLTLTPSVQPGSRLDGWTAMVNDVAARNTTLRFADNAITLDRTGATVIYMR